LRQPPGQGDWPAGQVRHVPPVQAWFGPQVWPHTPQLLRSLPSRVHSPLQHASCSPGRHLTPQAPQSKSVFAGEQTPLRQQSCLPHACPQVPQFAPSQAVSTQEYRFRTDVLRQQSSEAGRGVVPGAVGTWTLPQALAPQKPHIDGDRVVLDAACTATTFRFLDEAERQRILQDKKKKEAGKSA